MLRKKVLIILSLFLVQTSSATVIYTDSSASGSNNGTSWTNAYDDLQVAINSATAGDTIWVAEGTYIPSQFPTGLSSTDSRDSTFYINKDIVIYGGFDGTETAYTQRDAATNVTILSGDIGTSGDSTDNCYHVMITANLDSTAVIDGFTIEEGNADLNSSVTYSTRSFNRSYGGGIYNNTSSPTITNCTIKNNTANYGGGMRNSTSSPNVSQCSINSNVAKFNAGGVNNYGASTPSFSNISFTDNTAVNGGASYNNNSSPHYDSCTFTNNKATNNGGGLSNTASTPNVINSVFKLNSATNIGGGIYSTSNTNITIVNSVFDDNQAANGGGVNIFGSSGTIINSIFTNNESSNNGGGLRVWSSSTCDISNCTFYANSSTGGDGGAIIHSSSTTSVANSIFWNNEKGGNTDVASADISGSGLTVTYSLTQQNSNYATGTGMLNDTFPDFRDTSDLDGPDDKWFTADDGLALQISSPVRNLGENDSISGISTDILGEQRISNATVDMGAYESNDRCNTLTRLYVDSSALAGGDGSSWLYALNHLQDAINCADSGDSIWIAVGTYKPTTLPTGVSSTDPRDKTFYLDKDIKIYGGFDGTETAINQRNVVNNRVTLSGDIGTAGSISDNSYHVLITQGLTSATVLDGITITKGNANGTNSIPFSDSIFYRFLGGGMYNESSSPTIINSLFTKNNTTYGGGMLNRWSSPTITNSSFTENSATQNGGGMSNIRLSKPTIDSCTFTGNNAKNGGGMVNTSGYPAISNTSFSQNLATDQGGGMYNRLLTLNLTINSCIYSQNIAKNGGAMYNDGSSPTLDSCIFSSNSATENGGGIYNKSSDPIINYSTFSKDSAVDGGGMYNSESNPTLDSCTFRCNSVTNSGGGMYNNDSEPQIERCLFSQNTAKEGGGISNFMSDPSFDNSIFSQNIATIAGGGMINNESSPTITGSIFSKDTAKIGGGLENINSSPILDSCIFSDNYATDDGGGIYNSSSNPTITNTFFIENESAMNGGGISNASSNPAIDSCTFRNNNADDFGGGMYNQGSNPAISNTTFSMDSSDYGGGIYNSSSDPIITNSAFNENVATSNGGGICNWNQSSPTIANCIFYKDSSANGGGIFNYNSAASVINCTFFSNKATDGGGIKASLAPLPTIANCIFWDNKKNGDNDVAGSDISGVTPTYSLTQENSTYSTGTGIINDTFPAFADTTDLDGPDDIWFTADDGLALLAGSPSRNTGDNTSVPSGVLKDINGLNRFKEDTADMGAYEYMPDCSEFSRVYVDIDATGDGDGFSWDDAHTDLQGAINCASSGDTIWVAEGTYIPTRNPSTGLVTSSRDNAFYLNKDIKIYGGFDGTETMYSQRDATVNLTILSGDRGTVGVTSDNCYHVIITYGLTDTAVIDGFTISGGNANVGSGGVSFSSATYTRYQGGGIYNIKSSPTISNDTITANYASSGGGLFNYDTSSPNVTKCYFANNTASNGGAAYNRQYSSPKISHSTFTDNSASNGGAVNNFYYCSPVISNDTFTNNSASSNGGAVYNSSHSSPIISYSSLSSNSASSSGGAMSNNGNSSPSLSYSTFTSNSAPNGGAIYNGGSSSPSISFSLFTRNYATLGGGMCNSTSSPIISNCTFSSDTALSYGGGIYSTSSSKPIISNSAFENNQATNYSGGAMYFQSSSSPTISKCSFQNNKAKSYGGGIYASGGYYMKIESTTFKNDSSQSGGAISISGVYNFTLDGIAFQECKASFYGGGLHNSGSSGDITNCIFYKDSAYNAGGGIYSSTAALKVTNSTFLENKSVGNGGGSFGGTFTNCIFAGNTKNGNAEVAYADLYNTTVSYCLTQKNSNYTSQTGVINNQNPLFVDSTDLDGPDNIWFTADDGLVLQATSPVIDKGSNASIPSGIFTDILDSIRAQGGSVDMGAYESENLCNNVSLLYVDLNATGDGNGTSWTDAMTELQDAIICADKGDTIWVAEGTYIPNRKPTASTDAQDTSFYLDKDIKIYGGFDGTETQFSQRNTSVNTTILSGDIGTYGDPSDNSYHVIITANLTDTAVLDGFTIQGGKHYSRPNSTLLYATKYFNRHYGGGMYNISSSPTIDSCGFTDNLANIGGGMYNYSSSPTLNNCSFDNDTALQYGGGIYSTSASNPIISNSTFENNQATLYDGGAMYFQSSSSPTISECRFQNNKAKYNGGSINIYGGSNAKISSTIFINDSSQNGGAIYIYGVSNFTIDGSVFEDCKASSTGGGVYNYGSFGDITNCIFYRDSAYNSGGGIYSSTASLKVTNSTFLENKSVGNGGAAAGGTFANCIFSGNTKNGNAEVAYADLNNTSVSYCLTQKNSVYTSQTGVINNQNPLFVDSTDLDGPDNIWFTSDDGLALESNSPVKDAGDNSAASGVSGDITGALRTQGGIVDMGAYERTNICNTVSLLYVDINATGTGDGTSWTDAMTELQDAINCADKGDTLWVAEGSYLPNRKPVASSDVYDSCFYLDKDIKIYGGFDGTETLLSQRDVTTNTTILSGDIGTSGDPSDNSYHVIVTANLTDTAVLDGFTIQGGKKYSSSSYITFNSLLFYKHFGGGMYNVSSSPTINGCIFTNNNAQYGGGMYNQSSSPMISNCTFDSDTAYYYGGGLYNNVSSPVIRNSKFEYNKASTYYGGGLYSTGASTPVFTNCNFSYNYAQQGGGLFFQNGSPSMQNCILKCNQSTGSGSSGNGAAIFANAVTNMVINSCVFEKNSATGNWGGGLYNNGSGDISNCIFYKDSSSYSGGGLYSSNNGLRISNSTFLQNNTQYDYGAGCYRGILKNVIFWGNTRNGSIASNSGFYGGTIDYSLVQALSSYTSRTGMINNQNPLFVDSTDLDGPDDTWFTADDGLMLQDTSPVLDVGLNTAIPATDTTDFIGNPRIIGGTTDFGAYEAFGECKLDNELPSAAGTYTSLFSRIDSGYVCYCDIDRKFLLGLDTSGTGAVIETDSVQLQIEANLLTGYTTAGGIFTNPNGGVIFNRKWNVKPTSQPISDVKVRYAFTDIEYQAVKDSLAGMSTTVTSPANLQMYKLTNGSAFADPHASGITGAVLDNGSSPSATLWEYALHSNGTDHTAEFMVSSFSGGGAGGGANGLPVPVELIHFSAIASPEHTATLDWATASEINNSHFVIERSYDGINFEQIDRVASNGNSNSIIHYAFLDETIAKAQNTAYYRLLQVDYDGTSTYTEVRRVSFDTDRISPTVSVYPNPFTGEIYVHTDEFFSDNYSITVLSISGAELMSMDVQRESTPKKLDVSALSSGVYFISVRSKNSLQNFKVIKQ